MPAPHPCLTHRDTRAGSGIVLLAILDVRVPARSASWCRTDSITPRGVTTWLFPLSHSSLNISFSFTMLDMPDYNMGLQAIGGQRLW